MDNGTNLSSAALASPLPPAGEGQGVREVLPPFDAVPRLQPWSTLSRRERGRMVTLLDRVRVVLACLA